ncbi:hypothetical protein JTE90_029517 [Oedothorax gibbosus]|uniref:BRF2-like C-terminal domain-containing protein n=1 Tax=Oedothorax gibbosus TaxID=931172 RepID=A0AAV6UG83_9ARAC|nr:hypothetical protein JTE90_029517 [Oedothorax gibbosus]
MSKVNLNYMGLHCKHCRKDAIDEEDEVCHNCGVVSEGITIDNSYNKFSTETQATFQHYSKKKCTEGLGYGISMLDMLSLKYSVSGKIKSSASELLNNSYATRSFRRKADIGVLAGCCLIHYMKVNKIHVTIGDLCNKLNCTKKSVFKYSKFIKEYLNSQEECRDVKDIEPEEPVEVPMTFDEKVGYTVRSYLENVSVENKDVLVEKTIALTKLANSLWLISGRSTDAVICAASFLCWKSMNQRKQSCNFQKFCKEFSLPYQKGMPRVKEIKDMLLKLGQNIPSFSKNYVNEKNVLFHLDYILQNSESLRNDLLPEEFTAEEVEKKEFSTFRKEFSRFSKTEFFPSAGTSYQDNMDASEVEISDTEISSYIRSDEQVEMMESLQNKALDA